MKITKELFFSRLLKKKMEYLLPKFGMFIRDESDFERCFKKTERLSKWLIKQAEKELKELKESYEKKEITLQEFNDIFPVLAQKSKQKPAYYCFRVRNGFSESVKEEFLKKFKENTGHDHPRPDAIQHIDAKLCMGFFLEELHPHPFIIDANGRCQDANGRKNNFYSGLIPLDLFAYAIDFEDMIHFDRKCIRYHKTWYKSKVYAPGSTELIDYIWQPGSFEFAIEPVQLREKMLREEEKEREEREKKERSEDVKEVDRAFVEEVKGM